MLRESSELAGIPVDLHTVVDTSITTEVPAGRELLALADALVSGLGLVEARSAVVDSVGPIAASRAVGVIANFETMNRILDAGAVRVSERHRANLAEVGLPVDW
ncbi:MAG: hypothetical protein HKN07_08775 [Acidimicrobiia bacterium]|nr:hypothetical protein [Acidimicrobiia bacterium]